MGKRSEWDSTIDEAGLRRLLAAYESGVSTANIARRFDRSVAWVKQQVVRLQASSSNHGNHNVGAGVSA